MIDLSHYVNKEVKITLKGGYLLIGRLYPMEFCYRFRYEGGNLSYHRNGTNYWHLDKYTIVKIEPVNREKPKSITPNTLDSKTLHTIASALTPEAIKYIGSHEKYAEVMQALIIEFVEKNLGPENGELPFMIFDRMFLVKGRD